MKAIQYTSFGASDVLKLVELPIPTPQEGEVLVKIAAASINPVDVKIRKGLLTSRVPAQFPVTPGWDLSGTIVERGHGSRRFEIGDRVMGYIRRPTIQHGTYAEYITVPECYLAKAPTSIPLTHAAAVPLASLTSYQALNTIGHLKEGESVVIYGASGGVGSFAVRLAAIKKATIVAIASEKNHQYLKDLGAHYTIDYTKDNVEKELRSYLPEGVDLAYDCVGTNAFSTCFDLVKPTGRVVSLLVNQPEKQQLPNPSIEYHYWFVEPNSKDLSTIKSYIDDGLIPVTIDSEFPLHEAAKAQDKAEAGHTRGKIIVVNN